MTQGKSILISIVAVALVGSGITFAIIKGKAEVTQNTVLTTRPALNVTAIHPVWLDMPKTLMANGSIAAWQEAIIGAEVGDLRLNEVRVQVGEKVRKGQILATFANASVLAEVAQGKAAVAEAEAVLAEAQANAARAREVAPSGALSRQQIMQYITAEKTAKAKVAASKAQLNTQLLRLRHTQVVASDDGIISSRTATLGAVTSPGQELFRLIRQNRLEWQAEVTAAEMAQLKAGIEASVIVPNVGQVGGKIRFLAPTLDIKNRNGLVYVDLPDAANQGLRAGMFAQGEFQLGSDNVLTIPQSAITLRDGFSYVFRLLDNPEHKANDLIKVAQTKVQLGRQMGDAYAIISGLKLEDTIVANGATFLADADNVRVIQK